MMFDEHEFTRKKLKKYRDDSHSAAIKFIEIVTNAAGDQMEIEGIEFDPENISITRICELAAKQLNADFKEIFDSYQEFMLLEKMISYE